jgi:nicotinamidase-related amidase
MRRCYGRNSGNAKGTVPRGPHSGAAGYPLAQVATVTKRRVSAFTGSDLEVVLRARGISHLVLAGIATSGVVLSTLRQAADLDYRLTVLTDGCLDADPDVHQILLGRVFPRQAEVTTIADWAARLHAAPSSTDDH